MESFVEFRFRWRRSFIRIRILEDVLVFNVCSGRSLVVR